MQTSNITSSVILSAPAVVDSNKAFYFTTPYNPTSNVAGKLCYLKVVTALACVSGSTNPPIDKQTTYFITIDLPQPFSSCSVNEQTTGGTLTSAQTLYPASSIVGTMFFSTNGIPTYDFPTIPVRVPSSPTQLTVTLFKANLTNATVAELSQLTVIFELTPIA